MKPARHLGEARHRVGDALDETQKDCRHTHHREESRQNDRGGFVTKIPKRLVTPAPRTV